MEQNKWTQETRRVSWSEPALKPLLLPNQFIEFKTLHQIRSGHSQQRAPKRHQGPTAEWSCLQRTSLCYSRCKCQWIQNAAQPPQSLAGSVMCNWQLLRLKFLITSQQHHRTGVQLHSPELQNNCWTIPWTIPQLGADHFSRDPSCSGAALVLQWRQQAHPIHYTLRAAAGAQNPEQQPMWAWAEQFYFSMNRQVRDTAQFLTLLFLQF